MIKHPKLIIWEEKLRKIFDSIDDFLEDKYGNLYPLHPVRAKRGTTANKAYDGLFDIGASFTSGFGSELGAGYTIEVRLATLSKIPADIREKIEEEVVELLKKKLPNYFPENKLKVARDGNVYKIFGDLILGEV